MSAYDDPRIIEINRVMRCIDTNFVGVLDLPMEFTDEDVKSQYKALSLLLHPDKAPPGYEAKAKTAFTSLNAAKEAMDTPEKLKAWQRTMQIAATQVQEERSLSLSAQRREELVKMAARGVNVASSAAAVTAEDVKKMPEYPAWVKRKIEDTLIQESFKKAQLAKRDQEDLNELMREKEEQELRQERVAALAAGRDLNLLGKTALEADVEKIVVETRVRNWQQFQSKRPMGRYARARVAAAPAFPSTNPLVSLGASQTPIRTSAVDDTATTAPSTPGSSAGGVAGATPGGGATAGEASSGIS